MAKKKIQANPMIPKGKWAYAANGAGLQYNPTNTQAMGNWFQSLDQYLKGQKAPGIGINPNVIDTPTTGTNNNQDVQATSEGGNETLQDKFNNMPMGVQMGFNAFKSVGKVLSDAVPAGLQAAAALLPEHKDKKYMRPYLGQTYNPYQYGTGSSNLFEEGGAIDMANRGKRISAFTANDTDMTMYPSHVNVPQAQDYTLNPLPPINIPHPNREVMFEPMYNANRQQDSFVPRFGGDWNKRDIQNFWNNIPNQYGGYPVLKGDSYTEFNAAGTNPYFQPYSSFDNGGGLSRAEDYGSKSHPYPSVASKDFAGGGRSYPIPTHADAVDALRLAGLHGRGDVKAKVYAKYPDLKKKNGGKMSFGKKPDMYNQGGHMTMPYTANNGAYMPYAPVFPSAGYPGEFSEYANGGYMSYNYGGYMAEDGCLIPYLYLNGESGELPSSNNKVISYDMGGYLHPYLYLNGESGELPTEAEFAASGIHINPANKGKFTATKKKTGKTTEQLTHSKNPLTRKRAIFAQNARKWHHGEDGLNMPTAPTWEAIKANMRIPMYLSPEMQARMMQKTPVDMSSIPTIDPTGSYAAEQNRFGPQGNPSMETERPDADYRSTMPTMYGPTQSAPSNDYSGRSFKAAFDAARKDMGAKGVFTWNGKQYNTRLANDNKHPQTGAPVSRTKQEYAPRFEGRGNPNLDAAPPGYGSTKPLTPQEIQQAMHPFTPGAVPGVSQGVRKMYNAQHPYNPMNYGRVVPADPAKILERPNYNSAVEQYQAGFTHPIQIDPYVEQQAHKAGMPTAQYVHAHLQENLRKAQQEGNPKKIQYHQNMLRGHEDFMRQASQRMPAFNRARKQLGFADGGQMNVGDEMDLTPEQIAYYRSQGYDFE